jgi:hypothetical protein
MTRAEFREAVMATHKIDPQAKAVQDTEKTLDLRLSHHPPEMWEEIEAGILAIHFVGGRDAIRRGDINRLDDLNVRLDRDLQTAILEYRQRQAGIVCYR